MWKEKTTLVVSYPQNATAIKVKRSISEIITKTYEDFLRPGNSPS